MAALATAGRDRAENASADQVGEHGLGHMRRGPHGRAQCTFALKSLRRQRSPWHSAHDAVAVAAWRSCTRIRARIASEVRVSPAFGLHTTHPGGCARRSIRTTSLAACSSLMALALPALAQLVD